MMLAFVLSRAQTALTRYVSDAQQQALALPLERTLYEGLTRAPTPGRRITHFRTYREVATSREALGRLADILAGKLEVPGMTLRSRDRFDIIRALMAAGDARAPGLLKEQSEADKSDDARRYAYAAGAAAPDASVKQKILRPVRRRHGDCRELDRGGLRPLQHAAADAPDAPLP